MKSVTDWIIALTLATITFAGGDSSAGVLNISDRTTRPETATHLSVGPHQGTLHHLLPVILSGPVKGLIPVTIHLDSGPIVTGEAQYDEKTDRYDIRTIYAFRGDAQGKVKEEWVSGYVVDSANALGFPAMNKGAWITKPSPTDPAPNVTVFIIKTAGITIPGIAPAGTRKGTMLHWLPAGSGSPEILGVFGKGPSPIAIRLDDGSIVFGDAVYDEKTNCHDISVNTVVSLDKDGNTLYLRAKGYVAWKGGKPGPSCPNNRGTFASSARFTDKPIPGRDNVEVVFTPVE